MAGHLEWTKLLQAGALAALMLVLSPCAAASARSAESSGNPVISMYRRWTQQYVKDAQDAQAAAEYYAMMTKKMEKKMAESSRTYVPKELERIRAPTWAYSAWAIDDILSDQTAAKGAAAAAKAAAPYNKAYADYNNAKMSYDSAAVGYALRAKQDAGLAKQLMTYSDQFRLQGRSPTADTYSGQAQMLMKQAENYKGLADQYSGMSHKIYSVLPTIQDWAGKAGAFAAYGENPTNAMSAKDAFPYTVVPPAPVDAMLMQTDAAEERKSGQVQNTQQLFLAPRRHPV
mmetsp:Transcript_155522/g.290211  ORF Transcript_155522/g.290211 Transcript_155522/m.290211 type:complete len:287 (-) Transcript_155522:62-922(-)